MVKLLNGKSVIRFSFIRYSGIIVCADGAAV